MTIAPLKVSVAVKVPPARAFVLFTQHMSQWWTKNCTHGPKLAATYVVEPKAGGRWFERDAEGTETNWGKVLAYEPPHRLLLGWQLDSSGTFDPDFLTEVEITFNAREGGTEVRLEHRNLERFGVAAPDAAAAIGRGWPLQLGEFVAYADQHQKQPA